MLWTESVTRFSFNLAPRMVHAATRAVRVAAMRCHSTERRRYTLLALALRCAENIETKIVHNGMYKKRL